MSDQKPAEQPDAVKDKFREALERKRNQHHMRRYTEDKGWLFEEHLDDLLAGYAMLAAQRSVAAIRSQLVVPG